MIYPFIGRPLYSPMGAHYLSEKQFYTNQSSRAMAMMTGQNVSSLLPDSFNSLLCMALNGDGEEKPTHFVMLHGDIAPQNCWLSMMLDEAERIDADILSAVIKIKTEKEDKTSTAIGVLDGRYSKFRHISSEEAAQLPPTFTAKDIGEGTLLVNTGLMVIDLRKPWVTEWFKSGGFRLESHAWQEESGEWKALCLPEDWLMSWDAQTKFGAKVVAATTKVRAIHFGETGFENRRPMSMPPKVGAAAESVADLCAAT